MQIQATNLQAKQLFKFSPNSRENSLAGNERIFRHLGNIQRKENTPAFRANRFPSLDFVLGTKTIIQVGNYQGNFQNLIPDEATQNKLINDIYTILKKHPKFDEQKKEWREQAEVWEVLNWIAEKLNRIVGKNWMVARDTDHDKDFHLIIYHTYATDTNFHALPLSFLLKLKEKNGRLHNMIISLVALIEKHTGAEKWDGGYGEMALSAMNDDWEFHMDEMDLDKEGAEDFRMAINAYEKGCPNKYLKLINQDKTTAKQLQDRIKKFKPKDKIEDKFSKWIKQGLQLLSIDGHIGNFCFNPDDPMNENENPLFPDKYFCFIWDWEDKLYEYHNSYVQNDFQNYGVLPFCGCRVWTTGDKQLSDLQVSEFPKKITEFFSTGMDLISEFEKS